PAPQVRRNGIGWIRRGSFAGVCFPRAPGSAQRQHGYHKRECTFLQFHRIRIPSVSGKTGARCRSAKFPATRHRTLFYSRLSHSEPAGLKNRPILIDVLNPAEPHTLPSVEACNPAAPALEELPTACGAFPCLLQKQPLAALCFRRDTRCGKNVCADAA